MNLPLLLLWSLWSSLHAQASYCPEIREGRDAEGTPFRIECLDFTSFRRQAFFASKPSVLSQEQIVRYGKVAEERWFNIDGEQTQELRFRYQADGTILKTALDFRAPGMPIASVVQQQWIKGELWTIRSFRYEDVEVAKDQKPVKKRLLVQIDAFFPESYLVKRRAVIGKKGEVTDYLEFDFQPKELADYLEKKSYRVPRPIGFRALDKGGREIARYRQEAKLSEKALSRLPQDCGSKEPVLIFDTGFDLYNDRIPGKIWCNAADPVDGRDNDGNGLTDDYAGWHGDLQSNSLSELLFLEHTGRPISHGSHVLDIALSGRESHFRALALAGDFTKEDHLARARSLVAQHKIRFGNMSFGFGDDRSPIAPDSGAFHEIYQLIRLSPGTLFFVAAGNDGSDIDSPEGADFPASYQFDNLLVVGALSTNTLEEQKIPRYEMADFSNKGIRSVDLLAPGDEIEAARIGGGTVALSGTSMASPFALNHGALALAEKFPELSVLQIKEILMKSAYVLPLRPFPVRSGGILFPRRAFRTAELFAGGAARSIRAAALLARKQGLVIGAENSGAEFLAQLERFWESRGD